MTSLLTMNDVAALLKVTRRQVEMWVSAGRLQATKFGRHAVRVEPKAVEDFIAKHRTKVAA